MNIGLLGFGVVGGGVWELAQENRALNVKKVLVRREAPPLGKAAVQDVEAILRDTDIDIEILFLHPLTFSIIFHKINSKKNHLYTKAECKCIPHSVCRYIIQH